MHLKEILFLIDEKLLNTIISRFKDPSYSVCITGFKQKQECGKGTLILDLEQSNPNFWKLLSVKDERITELEDLLKQNNIDIPDTITKNENINNIINKKLIIDTELAYSDDKNVVFESKLTGNVDILGLQKEPKKELTGYIQNFFTTITSKDNPVRITPDKIRFHKKNGQIVINTPKDITKINISLYNKNPNDLNNSPRKYIEGEDYTVTHGDNTVIDILNSDLKKNTKPLWFYISYEYKMDIFYGYVELCETPMSSEIKISFNKKFVTLPTVIITDDAKNGKFFSGYNCEFIQDVNTKLYTGVIISLLNLKPKSTYPNVSIAILGGDVVD